MRVESNKAKGQLWIQMDLSKSAQVYPKAQRALQILQKGKNKCIQLKKVNIIIIVFKIYKMCRKIKSYTQKNAEYKVHLKAMCSGKCTKWRKWHCIQ